MRRRQFLMGTASLAVPAALSAPAIAQPSRASTLRFVPQANLSVLDPIWTTATVTGNHGYYVFDTLYSADSKLMPKPQMAEGHEVSDNRRQWRFRLRDGLKFHDGTPVRSADCIASLQRWAKRESFGQLMAKLVDRWVAVDDRTFEIHLTRPFELMLDALGKPDSTIPFIMPERLAQTDANTAIKEMVGSGPYRFIASEFNSGSRVVYEKFDGYVPRSEKPDWATGAKIAYFKRIEWNVIPDPATAAAALQNGEIDWWERPLADLQAVLEKNPNIVSEVSDPGGRMALMRLNHLQPPFNDVRIRRAVLMAVNQEDYMRAVRGDDTSLWTTSRCLYPKGTPYYRDVGTATMPGSIAAARAALKEAGYAGQKVVIINPTDFPDIGPLGQVTADLLKQIGMNVDLQESDWGTVVQRRSSREPVEKGGWSIFHTTGSSSGYASPAVSPLVRGQGASGWFGWWTSPKAEEMTQNWLDATDEASQKRLADAIATLALEEVATVPLGLFYIRTMYRKTITGILPGAAPYPWGVRPV
jgi:peptide/nickel transport system substrate-binding protein